jgi:hypothetical protein
MFDSRRRVNFYEAGSGQELIRDDWFTLLFEFSTNNLRWLVFVVSFNGATKLILKPRVVSLTTRAARLMHAAASFSLKLTPELFVISISFRTFSFPLLA